MLRTATAFLIAMFFATSALAQTACETQAVSKEGKPLAGAAKTAFVKKARRTPASPRRSAAMESRWLAQRRRAS
jgi:hypothetical protein